jgi:zinc transporter 1/2/3
MSIHAFFECLAVGLQQSLAGTASLAVAIFVHKWAEGLTLGLMYEKDGYSRRTASLAVLFQGLVNVVGLLVGCLLAE